MLRPNAGSPRAAIQCSNNASSGTSSTTATSWLQHANPGAGLRTAKSAVRASSVRAYGLRCRGFQKSPLPARRNSGNNSCSSHRSRPLLGKLTRMTCAVNLIMNCECDFSLARRFTPRAGDRSQPSTSHSFTGFPSAILEYAPCLTPAAIRVDCRFASFGIVLLTFCCGLSRAEDKYAPPASPRMTYNFNAAWKFIKQDAPGAEKPDFDDSKLDHRKHAPHVQRRRQLRRA